jgi:hypothetical protein
MTDPKRLLDDAGILSSEERRILAAEARVSAPPDARTRIWSSFATAIGTGALGTSLSGASGVGSKLGLGGGASAGHALSLGAVVKLTLVGIGIGTSAATVNQFWSAREARHMKPVAAATHLALTQSVAAVSTRAVPTPASATPIEPASSRAVDKQGPAAVPNALAPDFFTEPATAHASRDDARAAGVSSASGRALLTLAPKPNSSSANAREESQLVGSARSMLRAGNAAVALQLIELATSRFPQGILIQEREALRIEALTALGRTSEAHARADVFVRAYPNSPHVSRVRGR